MKRNKSKDDSLKRNNRVTLMLNDRELRAINIYCQRFRIRNKSKGLREIIMTAILKRFDDELPSLWEVSEPSLFNSKEKEEISQR